MRGRRWSQATRGCVRRAIAHANASSKCPMAQAGSPGPEEGQARAAAKRSGQEGLTFRDLKLQGEGPGLGLGEGWWETGDLDVDREGAAAHRVGAADAEPAEKQASAALQRARPLVCHAGELLLLSARGWTRLST